MKVGDLVRMIQMEDRQGIVVNLASPSFQGNHTVQVLFHGSEWEKLNGLHWCDPRELEVIHGSR